MDDLPVSTEELIGRLERAGATLLAMNVGATGPAGFRTNMPTVVRSFEEAYGWTDARARAVPPDNRAIADMDVVLGWIGLIPADRYVLRRIVGARALVSPVTGKHLFAWSRIAKTLGAHHEAIRRWHGQGVNHILLELARPGLCASTGGRIAPPARSIARAIERAGERSGQIRAVEFA